MQLDRELKKLDDEATDEEVEEETAFLASFGVELPTNLNADERTKTTRVAGADDDDEKTNTRPGR